mgnify:CR=1 FL=1
MRELKFRFIDIGDGTVYKPITLKELCLRIEIPRRIILESENGDFVDTDDFLDLLEKGELIADQYTGLKDKNGKEIYEGDIVTLTGEWEEIECGDCHIITYENGCFRVGEGYENEAGSYLSDWRIIGNIHENHELLEEE